MTDYQTAWDLVVIRHNGFSYFMFAGIIIGCLMIFSLVTRWKSSTSSIHILCCVLGCMTLVLTDVWLGYTGLMKYVLHLNNTTESLVIAVIPLLYFLVQSILVRKPFILREDFKHLLIPVLYFIYQWAFFLQPLPVKLNSHIGSFQPDSLYSNFVKPFDDDPLGIGDKHHEIIMLTAILYLFLIIRLFRKSGLIQNYKEIFGWNAKKLIFIRNTVIFTILFFSFCLVIFLRYEDDLGDHFIAMFISYLIFTISYFVINESRIFEPAWIAEKYETSGFSNKDLIEIQKIRQVVEHDKFYTERELTLKLLAQKMDVHPNLISQIVNSKLNINFNEFINQYRIAESKVRLKDESYQHLSIEGIGQSVGFKSKSSFYSAFRKITGMTPKAYQDQVD